jgi:hypothetical protein
MATAARLTVSTTPLRLDQNTSDNTRGHEIIIKNMHGTDDLVLGGSNVAAGTGFRLPFGQTLTIRLNDPETIYGIRGAAADIPVDVLYLS